LKQNRSNCRFNKHNPVVERDVAAMVRRTLL
jgi:hypothetical protein